MRDACVLMGVIEVRYSLIVNFIILIWGGASPLPDPLLKKIQKLKLFSTLKFKATRSITVHAIKHYASETGCKQTTKEGKKVNNMGAIEYGKDLRPDCGKYISQNRICFQSINQSIFISGSKPIEQTVKKEKKKRT